MADQINLQLTKGRWVRGQETREIRLIDSCLTGQCFLEGGVKCKPINQWLYLKLVKYCMLQYTLPSRGFFSNPFRPLVVEYQCNVSRKENSVLFDPLSRNLLLIFCISFLQTTQCLCFAVFFKKIPSARETSFCHVFLVRYQLSKKNTIPPSKPKMA